MWLFSSGSISDEDKKQELIHRFQSLTPEILYVEARVEKCRATKDLFCCGKIVKQYLPCQHASLCIECAQKLGFCLLCNKKFNPKSPKQFRLYDHCVQAGFAEDIKEIESSPTDLSPYQSPDARRLFTLFTIAAKQKLVRLVENYVTEVCYNERLLSSDPIASLLLDPAIVKEWCRLTFESERKSLKEFYLEGHRIHDCDVALNKSYEMLSCVLLVLERLSHSFPSSHSHLAQEFEILMECVARIRQHLKVMLWVLKHNLLGPIPSKHSSFAQFKLSFRQRKSSMVEKTWKDYDHEKGELTMPLSPSLFVEESMDQLYREEEGDRTEKEIVRELQCLCQSPSSSSPSSLWRDDISSVNRYPSSPPSSTPSSSSSSYPFESIRCAVDFLFLRGSSVNEKAKISIFLYYLFDILFTFDDGRLVDFSATFDLNQQSMASVLLFFCLDQDDPKFLQIAHDLLSQIGSDAIHHRIACIFLEREQPFSALCYINKFFPLTALTTSHSTSSTPMNATLSSNLHHPFTDGESRVRFLSDVRWAVTAVRCLLQADCIQEAFVFLQSYIRLVSVCDLTYFVNALTDRDVDALAYVCSSVHTLVGEFFCHCMRMGMAKMDSVLHLPWNEKEEVVLKKCFLQKSKTNPLGLASTYLFMFYVHRFRFVEALEIHSEAMKKEEEAMAACNDLSKSNAMKSLISFRREIIESYGSRLSVFATSNSSLNSNEFDAHEQTLFGASDAFEQAQENEEEEEEDDDDNEDFFETELVQENGYFFDGVEHLQRDKGMDVEEEEEEEKFYGNGSHPHEDEFSTPVQISGKKKISFVSSVGYSKEKER